MPQQDPTPLAPAPGAPRHALRERVASAIVDAAANVLAAGAGDASMSDVAAAAGVARATVYRYFPSRQALLDALARVAISDAASRLVSARIDQVSAEEGVPRAVRALIEVGDAFIVVARGRVQTDPGEFERSVVAWIAAVFERGQSDGTIRDDVPPRWLAEALIALVTGVVGSRPALGKEDAVATITSTFLDGARPPRQRLS